jgi:hypothetical protein
LDFQQSPVKLAEHNRVQMKRMLGHGVTEGNETDDQLVRTGSGCPFTGLEPACSTSAGASEKLSETG